MPHTIPEDQHLECIRRALETLGAEDRSLILEYYAVSGTEKIRHRINLAQSLGITGQSLRIRAFRIRYSLEIPIRECLESPSLNDSRGLAELVPVIEKVRNLEPTLISHLKQHSDDLIKLNHSVFEHLVAEFLASQGFDDVRLVGRNSKTSADIYAAKYLIGADVPIRIFVEVKRWKAKIGIDVINHVLGAYIGERERFGWNAALIVTVGGFKEFEKWTREELAFKGIHLKDRNDLLRYLEGYQEHPNGLWLPSPRTDLDQ